MRDEASPTRPGEAIDLAAVPDFALGRLLVQPSSRRVSAGGRQGSVEPRVMQALIVLAEAAGAVVSRDALIDRCWGGRIVGEDAINRCVAKIRRLAETAEPPAFTIETVAKVGYRLRIAAGPDTAPAAITPPPPNFRQKLSGRRARLMRVAWGVVLVAAVLATGAAWWVLAPSPPPADRMTLRIDPFTATGPQSASDLAAEFTQAAIERLSQDELLVVSTAVPTSDANAAAARYILSGTIHADGGVAKIAVQMIERPTGHLLYTAQTQQPALTGQQAVYDIAVKLLAGVERHLREAERARYAGRPRDVQDMVLQAAATLDGWGPAHDPEALALGERALARDPSNLPAQAVMATLLYNDFLDSDAGQGDAEGRRALALIDNVLIQHPHNLVDRHLHAALLAAVGDLQGAQFEMERALEEEPENPGSKAVLSAVLLQRGDVAGSVRILPNGEAPDDAFPAAQAFALSRYQDALATLQRVEATGPQDEFATLFKAAVLARLGQLPAARAAMARALPDLPPELRHVGALRQVLFNLPQPSWDLFKDSLHAAGMPA